MKGPETKTVELKPEDYNGDIAVHLKSFGQHVFISFADEDRAECLKILGL